MNYIIAIGTFQALVATVLLWRNRLRSQGDSLLVLLLFCIAAHLAIKFYIYSFVTDTQVRLQMNTFIGVCYGPLLYLYAFKKKDPSFTPIRKWYLFLPFLLSGIGYLTATCVLMVSAEIGYFVLAIYNNTTTWLFLVMNAVLPAMALYISSQLPAGKEKERLLITEISYCLLFISLASIVNKVILQQGGEQFNQFFRSGVYAILAIICIVIVRFKYVGVLNTAQPEERPAIQPGEASQSAQMLPTLKEEPITISFRNEEVSSHDVPPLPARKLQLTAEEHERIWDKMEQHLARTKIFTDSDLSLDRLAQALQINKYHLSETLNSYAGRTFYQYINERRIGYMLEKMHALTEKELQVNVLSLAYESGFKAKSSFNQYFKKITGHTPTEYLKALAFASPAQ